MSAASPAVAGSSRSRRKPRLLWANHYCLLDLSSGASMAVNEMLTQLVKQGYEVMVIGATIFDAEKGTTRLREHWETLHNTDSKVVSITDGPLVHRLVKTRSIVRNQMTGKEQAIWYRLYVKALDEFKPDLVYYYGAQPIDLLIPDEAHARGIPCAAYLANGNYQGTRWCRDVDLIITDSQATSNMYRETEGVSPLPVGAFIDPRLVVADRQERKHLLLVNPSLQKGAGLVIRMALLLEKRRPDITFEVVESRGNWQALVEKITAQLGEPRTDLNNVIVTPNTNDMRPVYARARLLLALSLWWESFGRVAAEATMNGVPVIYTDNGGLPEAVGEGGIKITLPPALHKAPYSIIPTPESLEPLLRHLERLHDDESLYQQWVARAFEQGKQHRIETSTARLMKAFAPLIQKRAGDRVGKGKPVRPNKQLEQG
ncbi:MAG: glycosyltransferase [Pseudomonadota bacterium]